MKLNKSYFFPVVLTLSVILGGVCGYFYNEASLYLKPLGTIFLNLILTAMVPLVFFSVSSAVESMVSSRKLARIFSGMAMTFVFTGTVAAIFMLGIVKLFPPAHGANFNFPASEKIQTVSMADHLVNMFTAPDFMHLFSHQNMLPLICFSILVGASTALSGNRGKSFGLFLQAGNEIFNKVIATIMLCAPVGFFAFFAVIVAELGPKLLSSYFHVTLLFYLSALFYFVIAFSLYAFLAGNKAGIKIFWKYVHLPAIISLATCSSAASIPANMQANKKMGVSPYIYETVIPLGTFLHKEGSILGGVVKIAFLFGLFHLSFTGLPVLLTAVLVSLLVGTVMGAIPSGGMMGEMLILSLYGFPPESLLIIVAISVIIDPAATVINVAGNNASSLMVSRLVEGRNWLARNKKACL